MFLEGPLKTSKMHVHLHVIAQPNLPVRRLGFFKNSTIPTSEAPTQFEMMMTQSPFAIPYVIQHRRPANKANEHLQGELPRHCPWLLVGYMGATSKRLRVGEHPKADNVITRRAYPYLHSSAAGHAIRQLPFRFPN